MTHDELKLYVEAAGGKIAFAALIGVTERYADMLLNDERQMSKRLDDLIRLKITLPADTDKTK
jgi:hypothetical protein